jgi:hypothetical protein
MPTIHSATGMMSIYQMLFMSVNGIFAREITASGKQQDQECKTGGYNPLCRLMTD